MKHIKIPAEVTAHIYTSGNESGTCFWLICHGYAMTADQILKKFRDLNHDDNIYYSAEALSHFYFPIGETQQAVASWMTSRFRLDEISNYCRYLGSILEQYGQNKKRILFGFSQGGTTMWRFINESKPDFDYFINWGGDIPLDTVYDVDYLEGKKLLYMYGDRDQYITNDRAIELKARCMREKLDVDFIRYDGTHKIDRQELLKIATQLK